MLPSSAAGRPQDWCIFIVNRRSGVAFAGTPAAAVASGPHAGPAPGVAPHADYAVEQRLHARVSECDTATGGWRPLIDGDLMATLILQESNVRIEDASGAFIRSVPRRPAEVLQRLMRGIISEDPGICFSFEDESSAELFHNYCAASATSALLPAATATAQSPTTAALLQVASTTAPTEVNDETTAATAATGTANAAGSQPVLYGISATMSSPQKMGAGASAMALCTKYPFVHVFKPLLLLALDSYMKAPEVAVIHELHAAVVSMISRCPSTLASPLQWQMALASSSAAGSAEQSTQLIPITLGRVPMKLRVPLTCFEDDIGDVCVCGRRSGCCRCGHPPWLLPERSALNSVPCRACRAGVGHSLNPKGRGGHHGPVQCGSSGKAHHRHRAEDSRAGSVPLRPGHMPLGVPSLVRPGTAHIPLCIR